MWSVGGTNDGYDILVLDTANAVKSEGGEEEIGRQLGHVSDRDRWQDKGRTLETAGIKAW